MGRQARMQALHFGGGEPGARGIVGVGDEDDFRARGHGGEDRVHIGGVVLFRNDHRRGARRQNRDAIDQKAMLGEDALVALVEIGGGGQMQHIVRAIAADDPRGVEPVAFGDGGAQALGGAIGIEFETASGAAEGFNGLGRGAKGRLVGGELVDLLGAGRAALAGHIGLDLHDAGARDGTVRVHGRHSCCEGLSVQARRGGRRSRTAPRGCPPRECGYPPRPPP